MFFSVFRFLDINQEFLDHPIERLQLHAAKFVIDIRKKCRVSQSGMTHIMDGFTGLLELHTIIIIVSFS